ncbi:MULTISPECIES: hypothetical protein [unclassified Endozoicomonas]|uniref:hypothetical protein n=1 Tax=unclassified Endozoicomonas TaxID=2644528 RepID=UPI00214815C8|nr:MULTISPECIES: hypothetical protein [unclassified Endozoicomonas]
MILFYVRKVWFEESQHLLKAIFTERAEEASKLMYHELCYSLGDMLIDYLNKKANVPDVEVTS